ncbi:beta-xylosidase/alpha-l-arabinosidase [Arthrobacter burdickii]|uniref:Glycoside hydrolase family 3 N-terminal domain-containing protein n=1 Tax=Arthrobacter burdickii TaxID=3035920 RepID=A0ABT8JZ16_9MICC|nr:glycoside hydrolase family 3 N-terminal domain-containing protein [Arthrobacter burdickii]MDN4610416.1 glycoside hydrolase family 3 N-terminal domain-containing protein [Arthrobacter burdickii]
MTETTLNDAPWRNTAAAPEDRVEALIQAMTLREKVAQLVGVWVGANTEGGEVAPHQNEMNEPVDLDELLPHGLGQLTRPFGTAPVEPGLGALSLQRTQERIAAANRFGIPALVHEECLAGFAAWKATAYPVPLAWGATFNPELVRTMSSAIGADLRSVGVHQGLAPVLDVVRDARWGRVEETIGEDPYLIGTIATAYVQGLERAGVVATLKHFVGYSASKAGRNLAPVSIGERERADVLLPPFEMAIRESGVRSVMHAYTDIDGVPTAADASLLTSLLRDTWGFDGTVVADYFGIAFLKELHRVAATLGEAAAAALTAGVDVELPTIHTFGEHLLAEVDGGRLDEGLVDRALRRVLQQKLDLGLLDPAWSPVPPALAGAGADVPVVDLDTPANRAIASELAEQSIVLVRNGGILPLAGAPRIALIGPNADTHRAFLGCYSFPAHVGEQHPEVEMGLTIPTVADAVQREFAGSDVTIAAGCTIDGTATTGFDEALAVAGGSDVVVAVLGDRAGLFGRGTSGEGCDAESLALPGVQQQLLDELLATGKPVVVVLLTGRPYALGSAATDAAAVVQGFFPGEEGAAAVAGVLSGRINPSGRLPVSIPGTPGAQPSTYLAAPLAQANSVSNIDPTAAFAFGHGLSYTDFTWQDVESSADTAATDGEVTVEITVANAGERDGVETVQLYLHDPVASVVRPVQRLISYARVPLAAGASARVAFTVPADVAAFTGRDGLRVVEPGELDLRIGASSGDIRASVPLTLTGEARHVDHTRRLHCDVKVVTL